MYFIPPVKCNRQISDNTFIDGEEGESFGEVFFHPTPNQNYIKELLLGAIFINSDLVRNLSQHFQNNLQ